VIFVSENWDHWDEVEGGETANQQAPHCEDDEFNVGSYLCLIAAWQMLNCHCTLKGIILILKN